MKKSKKIIFVVLAIILSLVIILSASVRILLNKEFQTIATISQIDKDGNLFYMDYLADYDLDEMLDMNIDSFASLEAYGLYRLSHGMISPKNTKTDNSTSKDFACTSFSVKDKNNDYLYARNYDYDDTQTCIIKTNPKKGYKSISACVSFTLCLSESYGLRAYMGGKYYPVELAEPLCDVVGDSMPIVEKDLIYRYFYADKHSGRATIRAG